MKIVIDVDGVIANTEKSVSNVVRGIFPEFDYNKHVKAWGFNDLKMVSEEAYEEVFNKFKCPVFMRNLDRNKGVEEGIKKLSKDNEILIHTHMPFNKETYLARKEWLEELRSDTGDCFKYKISRGDTKCTLSNVDVLIEDNLENIQKSSAKIKILIRKSYNHKATEDCLFAEKPFIVNSFQEAVSVLDNF